MNIARWTRVQEIFHDALRREQGRAKFVATAAGGDAELEREVNGLLRAYERTGILPKFEGDESVLEDRLASDELDDMEDALTSALADRYVVEQLIGTGGMAAVYLAQDVRHGRQVAVKVMRRQLVDRTSVGRFLREIRLTANLNHPNILPLFDSGQVGQTPFYVMPFVDGRSLKDRIRDEGPLGLDEALRIGRDIASALDYAHRGGILHRDVKPANVLLRDDVTFVSDFGIGLALEAAGGPRLTDSGIAIGTPLYMSPEQVAGDASLDGRADVYAFGCLVYEMLAGEPPFTGKYARTIMMRHVRDPVPRLTSARPALGEAADRVFARVLAKAPADRFESAGAFVTALEAVTVDATEADRATTVSTHDGAKPIPDGRRGRDPATRPPRPDAAEGDQGTTLTQKIRICTAKDGVQIAYALSGEGPPLVKAANWLSHLEHDAQSPMWRHWWKGLSRYHTLFRYDERANGLSDWNAEDVSFEAWVDDLEAVVDHAGLDRFVLLGVSKGGAIATAYAHRHPERVEKLVMLGVFPKGRRTAGDAEWLKRAELENQLVEIGWGKENPAFRQLFSKLFFPDAEPERIEWFNELQRVSASPENAARIMRASWDIDVTREARELEVPTLIFHSRGDERVPIEAGRTFASLIPGAEFVPLPCRNHIPLEHEPAWRQFLEAFRAFTGVGSRGSDPAGEA